MIVSRSADLLSESRRTLSPKMFRGGRDDHGDQPDYRKVAPPLDINKRPRKYADVNQEVALSTTIARQKRVKLDDDYFDDDDDQDNNDVNERSSSQNEEGDDEEDPLDAFMAGLESEPTKKKEPQALPMSSKKPVKELKGVRDDIDDEDEEESYYKFMAENPNAGLNVPLDEDEEQDVDASGQRVEYDRDGNPVMIRGPNIIDPLPAIDHSSIQYEQFNKNFYEEHPDITSLNRNQVFELRKKLGIRVFGSNAPKPVCSFGHFRFDDQLMKVIIKSEYTTPTPIQSQAIPIALSGRDLIGVAKTGSGKTAAYLWPLIVHIMDQRDLKVGEGPIGLILAPTRELSQQIYTEAKKFAKVYNIAVVCVYGGGNKWEQSQDLQSGAEIVVATPGRMIDMIKIKATNLTRVTCLILDEADRMFDMGFEAQVRSICNHVRPDRQTMLFSATFKKKIERLAMDVLTDPIKVIQGESGEANEDITQKVMIFDEPCQKWDWLTSKLVEFTSLGSVLIFVTKKANSEELAANLRVRELEVLLIHGDLDQADRNKTITAFKRKECPILVATDVAARGLDIPHVRTVINYDVARDIDTHTHRIGRTGRAGEKGYAFTLVTQKDKEFVGHLIRNLEGANQEVPEKLMELAMKSSWFRNSRYKQDRVKKTSGGLGYRSRPGNTSSSSQTSHTQSSNSSSDSSTNRAAAMRAAFASQYKNSFKPATDTAWKSTSSIPSSSEASHAPEKRSRWN